MTHRAGGRSGWSATVVLAIAGAVLVASVPACSGGGDTVVSPGLRPSASARSGGDATVYDDTPASFSRSASGLASVEKQQFGVGNAFFNDNWVIAPATTSGRDGLGPVFNAFSCSGCHLHDGRAEPTTAPDDSPGLLLRLSRPGAGATDPPVPDPVYGGQLGDRANPGVPVEGTVTITTTPINGTYADGKAYTLADPHYAVAWGLGKPAPGLAVSPRVAPALIGPGLLEAIPVTAIVAAADPEDEDHDGISGRVNRVRDEQGKLAVGRFGWKAGQPSVRAQVAAAFVNDIGITSSVHPDQPCTERESACAEAASGGDPEIDDKKLGRVTFYNRTLAVPARRSTRSSTVADGAQRFAEAGCSGCHTPTQHTGRTDVHVLSDQTIHPYTDLLLHDMGPALADGAREYGASGTEWRTAPLWGIGLTGTVSGHTRFLHDGRARDLAEAILWHGGEAEPAKERFVKMKATDRKALLAFLGSL